MKNRAQHKSSPPLAEPQHWSYRSNGNIFLEATLIFTRHALDRIAKGFLTLGLCCRISCIHNFGGHFYV